MKISALLGCVRVAVLAAVLLPARGLSETGVIDFEGISQELPLWSAVLRHEGKHQYMLAAKWKEPFTLTLDTDVKHSGGASLRWEFSQNVEMVTLTPPEFPVNGSEITVRFFVRGEGVEGGEGFVAVAEMQPDKKASKTHWAVGKFILGHDWAEVLWTSRLETAPSALFVRFVLQKVPAGAKIWIDDFDVQTKN